MEDVVDEYILPPLPNEDVFFYSKRIDNSRLVRQLDNHAKGEWSAIAGVSVIALLVSGLAIAPGVAGVLDNYKIQALRQENEQLKVELRKVDVAEERMLNAPALDAMAPKHNLVRPADGQIIRLQPGSDHSFAMNGPVRPPSR